MRILSSLRPLVAASALLLLSAFAMAQSVDEVAPIKGTVLGEVPEGGAATIGLLLPEESTKTQVQVKLAKGSSLIPDVRIVHPDGTVFDLDDLVADGASVKVSSKSITIKNLPVGESGLYKVVVTGSGDSSGEFSFKSKAKFSKGLKLSGLSVSGTGDSNDHPLHVGENSFVSIKLKLDKKLPFGLDFKILTASGTEVDWDGFEKIGKDGSISIKNLPLPFFGDYILRVTSTAGNGNYSLQAKAKAKGLKANSALPTADAGEDGIVAPASEGQLDGSGTSRADSVLWTQVSGPLVTLDDPTATSPTFTTPAGLGTIAFQLVGSNTSGNSPADLVIMEIDTLPTAITGPAQYVTSGNQVTLTGEGLDADAGQELIFFWTQESGPAATLSSATGESVTFVPSAGGVYIFELRVSDGIGESDPDRITVIVDGAGPAAEAGRRISVRPMDTVFLSGLRSFAADGTAPSTWSWSRIDSDPASLTLEGADGPVPSFGAPKQDAVLRFRLTVDGNTTTTDEVVVIVDRSLPENASPIAVDPGETPILVIPTTNVTVTGTGSQDDGVIRDFEWLQVSGPDLGLDGREGPSVTGVAPLANSVMRTLHIVHDGSKYGPPQVFTHFLGILGEPVAMAGRSVTGEPGDLVTLDGSSSLPQFLASVNGYQWTQVTGFDFLDVDEDDGGFDPTAQMPSFTIPTDRSSLTSTRYLVFELVVTDSGGGTSTVDRVTVTLENLPKNAMPTVTASTESDFARPGDQTQLSAVGGDNDDDDLSYIWTQVSGPTAAISGDQTANPTVTGPTATGDMVFRVIVDDGTGEPNATAFDEVTVTLNQAPVLSVFATPATGPAGTEVDLDASGTTDPEGDELTFSWEEIPPQIGSLVTLAEDDTDTASFTMPAYTGSVGQRTRRFRVTIEDSLGSDYALEQEVTFFPNSKPVLSAITANGDRKFVYDNSDSETLSANPSTDADGDVLSFSWSIKSGPGNNTSSTFLSATTGSSTTIKVPPPTSGSNANENRGGVYVIEVVGNDGVELSDPVTIEVVAYPSFATHVSTILASRCATGSCHGGGAGGYTLSGSSSTNFNNTTSRTTTNDHQNSDVWSRINSGNMPKSGSKLPAFQINMFRDWIEPEHNATTKPGIAGGVENN